MWTGRLRREGKKNPKPSQPGSFFPLFSSYIYRLVDDAAALRYTTLSVLRDFAADGVVYLELRTTPRAMPAAGLTKAAYVETILDTIAEYERSQEAAPEPKLRTKLILSVCHLLSPLPSLACHQRKKKKEEKKINTSELTNELTDH